MTAPSSTAAGMMELLAANQMTAAPVAQQQQPQQVVPAAAAASGEEGDAAPARGRKRGASARPPDERVAAVQEKNRKAQKRFRERQKEKMASMEATIDAQNQQLVKLREENSALAGRNAVLEKVLALREDQLKSLQAGGSGEVNQGAAIAALSYAPLSAPGSLGMLALPPPSSSQVALPPPGAIGGSVAASASAVPQSFLESGGNKQAWGEYVRELSALTQDGKQGATPPPRLAQVVAQAAQLCAQNAMGGQSGRTEGQLGNGAASDPARWASVAGNLEVTDAQRVNVRELRDRHQQRIANIGAARAQLAASLQQSGADGMQTETVAKFQQSMQEEREAHAEFAQDLFTKVLTPLQFGRAAVQSYPFYVDGAALADLLSSDKPLVPGSGLVGAFTQLAPSMPLSLPASGGSSTIFSQLVTGSTPLSNIPTIGGFAGTAAHFSGLQSAGQPTVTSAASAAHLTLNAGS